MRGFVGTNTGSGATPQTGDSSSVLWLAILCISGVGALTVFGISKNRKKDHSAQ